LHKSIVILLGLGDFIAAEAYLTDAECNAIETIYFATAHRKQMQDTVRWTEIFPNLKAKKILYDTWTIHESTGLPIGAHYKHFLNRLDPTIDQFWASNELLDGNLPALCTDAFINKTRVYHRSRIASINYPMPTHVSVPDKYVLIHPWSDQHRTTNRDFTDEDWEGVLGCLERNNLIGVVVNKSNDYPPQHPKLIDLTNQTTLDDVFALAQRATYFMGIASFLHCFTPKVLPSKNIFIRSRFKHLESRTGEFMFYHSPIAQQDLDFKVYPSLNFLKDKDL
jgi:hypothetical protein